MPDDFFQGLDDKVVLPAQPEVMVAALKSLATPLPHDEAARIPLLVLPPNRVRLVNPIQELQAVLTLQLSVPGWGQRARTVAVYTSPTDFVTLTEADTLDGGAVLPGFVLPVREWFGELDRHG